MTPVSIRYLQKCVFHFSFKRELNHITLLSFNIINIEHTLLSLKEQNMMLFFFSQYVRLRFPHKRDVRFIFTSRCWQEGSCLFFVFVCAQQCTTHIVLYFSSSCVPCVASFSGLSIVYCNFGILWIGHCLLQLRYSLTFIRTFWAKFCNIIKNSKILKICNL